MKTYNVAIIGQGRSGRDIHGKYFLSDENKHYKVVATVDAIEGRRTRAAEEFGCPSFADYTELFAMKDQIDLVVNASFSQMHPSITIDLANHGFNVICEKPFARHAVEADDIIAAAKRNNVLVTVFQQARYAPYHVKVKEIIRSGILGRIAQVSNRWHGFSRRWDWQTSLRFNGGSMMNTGPHPMDQILDLMGYDGEMPTVVSRLDRLNMAGDAEDYVKVILMAPGKPLYEVEVNQASAFGIEKYSVYGQYGSISATEKMVRWKWYDPAENPMPALQLEPLQAEDGTPLYCKENLIMHEESFDLTTGAIPKSTPAYYSMLYGHLAEGKPLEITAEQVRRQICINELVHAQNPLVQQY